jgi:ABC-type multidrug transport system fused ATPase/permease subunit
LHQSNYPAWHANTPGALDPHQSGAPWQPPFSGSTVGIIMHASKLEVLPLPEDAAAELAGARRSDAAIPTSIFGYIAQVSGHHQVWLALLSVVIFLLTMGPLELQRRIVNSTLESGAMYHVALLCAAYAAFVVLSGGIKLGLNIYRGWVSERAVLDLRQTVYDFAITALDDRDPAPEEEGIRMSIILNEAEPVGGFVGMSISEPLIQAGTLLTVLAYMIVLQPWMALFSFAVFSLQLLFVPRLQRMINRRAAARIQSMRELSGEMIGDLGPGATTPSAQHLFAARIGHVFRLNMAIYWVKFTMNFLMNLTHHLGVVGILLVGGWYVVRHQLEIGTVVAFISGLSRVNEPWGELVNYYREMTVVSVKYRLVAGVLGAP